MRFVWTTVDPRHFDTFLEAYQAMRRAIGRGIALSTPRPVIVKMRGRYLVKGALTLAGSFHLISGAAGGPTREVLTGTPVRPARPKHRKVSRRYRPSSGGSRVTASFSRGWYR
jgi:hypothetical protein